MGGIFKALPYVPDKGIENVVKDLASRRSVAKEFMVDRSCFVITCHWTEPGSRQ